MPEGIKLVTEGDSEYVVIPWAQLGVELDAAQYEVLDNGGLKVPRWTTNPMLGHMKLTYYGATNEGDVVIGWQFADRKGGPVESTHAIDIISESGVDAGNASGGDITDTMREKTNWYEPVDE